MKLRLRGDSVRLRLTRAEVTQMRDQGAVEERSRIGSGVFVYRLESADVDVPDANFEPAGLTVRLPRTAVQRWADSDQVGIEADEASASGVLRILVEKDFKCLAPREGEDQSDAFEHPNAGRESC